MRPLELIDGRFRIESKIGEGRMGEVYRVSDITAGGVPYALKLLRDPELWDEFAAEFQLLRRLSHGAFVTAHRLGACPSGLYMVQELIAGETLEASGAEVDVGRLSLTLFSALDHLHGHGIVHGDLAPPNIIVSGVGFRILDLGASGPLGSGAGTTSGVLAYAAPERLQGGSLEVATDLFSVGVTLFQSIYGHHPFENYPRSMGGEPQRHGASHGLDRVLDRLLSLDPGGRHPSADAALSDCLAALKLEAPVPSLDPSRELPYVKPASFEALRDAVIGARRAAYGKVFRVGGAPGTGRTRLLAELGGELARARIPFRHYEVREGGALIDQILSDLDLPLLPATLGDEADRARSLARRILRALGAMEEAPVLGIDGVERADAHTRAVIDGVEKLLNSLSERFGRAQLVVSQSEGATMLGTMGVAEAEALVGCLFPGRRIPKSVLKALVSVSHGQARLLVRALTGAVHTGALRADAAAVHLDATALKALKLPQSGLEEAQAAYAELVAADRDALSLLAQARYPVPPEFLGGAAQRLVEAHMAALVPTPCGPRAVISTLEFREIALEDRSEDALRKRLVSLWDDSGDEGRAPRLWHRLHLAPKEACLELASSLESLDPERAVELLDLCQGQYQGEDALAAAAVAARQGRVQLARAFAQDAAKSPESSELRARAQLSLGRLEIRMARHADAREHFLKALEDDGIKGRLRAQVLEGLSRSAITMGCPDEAQEWATEGLGLLQDDDPATAGGLHYTLGLAAWYRADLDKADEKLKEALILTERAGDDAQTAAVITAKGLIAHRRGRMSVAAIYYREAMRMGEEMGDGSRVLTALQNLGVIHHQAGEWKKALDTYEEALAHAEAEAQLGRIMQLCGNLGNLWRYLGEFERARVVLNRGLELARQEKNRHMEGVLLTNLGEVELMDEAFDEAHSLLKAAVETTVATESVAEELEARMDFGRLLLERQDYDAARSEFERALELAQEGGHTSFLARARALLARSHRQSVHGDDAEAKRLIDLATADTESVTNLDFRWPVLLEACQQAAERGDTVGAARWAKAVSDDLQALEDGVAADFKASFRKVRERHRALAVITPHLASVPEPTRVPSPPDTRWMRLLEINKRLTTERDIKRLLEYIMDSAILLTGAERGFVLLESDKSRGLEVRVARNIDQENIRNTKFKISHSIASRVIEHGEPILTVDAMEDSRYRDQLSVHDLRLRSVICLPMRMMGRVLGAIYLDNRFQTGAFDASSLAFMESFADQAGIALGNARLVSALESSKSDLEGERRKVQALNTKLEEELKTRTQELEESHRVVIAQQQQLTDRHRYDRIIGNSQPLRKVFRIMDKMLDNTIPVLISGESGTGKELVARAIHFNGNRASRPFVALNCGAIPVNLLESELFGHVRGAFTGANQDKKGLFEAAHGGTLLLDELGELPLEMQVKLLRVLQDGKVKKVGSTTEIQVDVRIIAATNRQLESEIAAGRFREDLYYRLSVVPIHLPSLRERPDDIPVLVGHFLKKNKEVGLGSVRGITPAAMALLKRHEWPGNVRQLEMVLKNVSLFCDAEELDVSDFQSFPDIAQGSDARGAVTNLSGRSLSEIERAAIIQALHDNRGNKKKSAEMLGIDRRTLYNKLKAYNIVIEKELRVT